METSGLRSGNWNSRSPVASGSEDISGVAVELKFQLICVFNSGDELTIRAALTEGPEYVFKAVLMCPLI
jgi:hypothetical protein